MRTEAVNLSENTADLVPVYGMVLSVSGAGVDQRQSGDALLWTAPRQDAARYTVRLHTPEGISVRDGLRAAFPVVPPTEPVICHQPGKPVTGVRVNGILFLDLREAWDVGNCQ